MEFVGNLDPSQKRLEARSLTVSVFLQEIGRIPENQANIFHCKTKHDQKDAQPNRNYTKSTHNRWSESNIIQRNPRTY